MLNRLALLFTLVLPATVAVAQDHMMHTMGEGDSLAHRMPPMNMSMPMLPGLDTALPPVGPFLAGEGMDASMFPEATPRQVVPLADGDTLDLEATLVRRILNGKTFVMYGYNGQYPGPLIDVMQGSTIIVNFTNNIEMPSRLRRLGLDGRPRRDQAARHARRRAEDQRPGALE